MSRYHDYPLNILISYVYYTKQMEDFLISSNINYRLVIDSGAFTSWKMGKEIKLNDYCNFLNKMKIKPWRYFTLDVVGDPEQTNINYQLMLDRGFNPIPIFTKGENLDMIDEYYKTSDVVAFGGFVNQKGVENTIKKVMRKVDGRKVHLLGFTKLNFLKHYHPYMCDSSSCSSLKRYGNGIIYLGNGKTKTISKKDFIKKPNKEIIQSFNKWNIDYRKFSKKENWNRKNLDEIAFSSAVNLMLDVKKHLNVNYFIAIAEMPSLKSAVRNFKKLRRIYE